MLKSLEISGFKSFAKKGSLEFKTPISAIVGPNGSGKSNIAEAFRFVLGEQSMKSLRGKRGEDLIFSGSREERPMNRANVKVVFDNSNRFLDIDYDEVSIERVVHRDGVNQYFINKSQVRLKDISELLAGANIGSSGHHIISQGEADRILSVNPKERREIIEEALGLRVYQFKISESEKKLLKVEENIKSVDLLKREIKPHLNFLKKQVKRIEESFDLKNELRNLYKEYFKRESEYLKYQKNYIQENKKPLKEEMAVLDNELLVAESFLEKQKKEVENPDLIALENDLIQIRLKRNELGRKIGQIEGMIVFEERRIKKEEDLQNIEEERVIKFKEVKIFLDKLISGFEKGSFSTVEGFKKAVSEFVEKNSTRGEQKIKITADEQDGELSKLREEKKQLEEKSLILSQQEQGVIDKRDKLKKEFEEEKDSSRKAEVKIFEIKAKQSEIFSKLNSIRDLEARIEIEDENYKKELNESFILAGREATQFSDFVVLIDDILKENRGVQEERRRKIEKIKIKLEGMGVGSSDDVVREYKEVQERNEFLEKEISDLEGSAVSLNELICELKDKLDEEFKEGVQKINKQFGEFFATMFGGGRAELLVVKTQKRRKKNEWLDGIEEDEDGQGPNALHGQDGIDVDVSLPNKKTKGLQMLSGGERSLTSIALLFAMSQIKPPPFIILDETDAALDEANSRRYGDMIENLSKYSQLILITHNRETMARAGVLYGITMGMDGISRLLSVKLEEAVKVAK